MCFMTLDTDYINGNVLVWIENNFDCIIIIWLSVHPSNCNRLPIHSLAQMKGNAVSQWPSIEHCSDCTL